MIPTNLLKAAKVYEELGRLRTMREHCEQWGFADLSIGDLSIRLPQHLTRELINTLEEDLKMQLRHYGVDI